ncbi:two-component sensor histidine kinase, partial [Bacillus cereus]
MKNVSFRNRIITKLLGAVAISFFISFGLTILILAYVIDPLFIKHEEFGMFEFNVAMLFLFAFAIFTFIILFLILVRKKIV